jgi:hypothetical protein
MSEGILRRHLRISVLCWYTGYGSYYDYGDYNGRNYGGYGDYGGGYGNVDIGIDSDY